MGMDLIFLVHAHKLNLYMQFVGVIWKRKYDCIIVYLVSASAGKLHLTTLLFVQVELVVSARAC